MHSPFSLDPTTAGYLICYQQSQDGAKGMFARSVRYSFGIFSIFQVFLLTFGNMESILYTPNTGKVWIDHKETSLSPLWTSPLFQVQCQGDADHQVQPQQAGEVNYWVESHRSWNWFNSVSLTNPSDDCWILENSMLDLFHFRCESVMSAQTFLLLVWGQEGTLSDGICSNIYCKARYLL